MIRARKTKKRIKFIEDIIEKMKTHEIFNKNIERINDTENLIQKTVFSRLEIELPKIILHNFGYSIDKASSIVDKNFVFEKKKKNHLQNFNLFATNHRNDAVLNVDGFRIAFEIKKGNKGHSIRSGIGQSLVYATQFDFVLYFFVDTTPDSDINSAKSGNKESELINSLWENYNIKFFVV